MSNAMNETLRTIFLACFRNFGASTSDIASATGMSADVAAKGLQTLRSLGLAASQDLNAEVGRRGRRSDGRWAQQLWSTMPSHDDADESEALAIFDARVAR